MTTKYGYRNGILNFFDSTSHERVLPVAPIVFQDDFLGTLNTDHWTTTDDGGASEAKVANQHGGVLGLIFTNAGEKQEATIYGKDDLEFNIDKGPLFEWVVLIPVLPDQATEMYFGVAGAYVEGYLVTADQGPLIHAVFMLDGSGIVTIHVDDGTLDSGPIASGVTLTASATVKHVFKIDCTEAANVLFYIDGVRVASGTVFNMSTGSANLQPLASVFKAVADTGVGSLYLDSFKAWSKR